MNQPEKKLGKERNSIVTIRTENFQEEEAVAVLEEEIFLSFSIWVCVALEAFQTE